MVEPNQAVLQDLIRLAHDIAAGRYERIDDLFSLSATAGPDAAAQPVAELAEAFGLMVVQVEVREFHLNETIEQLREAKHRLELAHEALRIENQSLKQEVSRLSIEIDQTKRDSDVARIADTDYFRNLQLKADALRRRSAKPSR